MAAVDTNILVRLVTRDDPEQYAKALEFLNRNKPVWVAHLTVLELAWVLSCCYKVDKGRVCAVVRMLLDAAEFNVQQPAVLEAALDRWEASGIDFADAFILESARAASEIPLATFDARLGRLDGAHLLE
ncbi:MAG: type II toxin-antitoxin system VapC family toxin [Acidobacteria bacterium]|nr:type II toxin-antitoxin system VapC family toxin [Acidobacteriota bacterium]